DPVVRGAERMGSPRPNTRPHCLLAYHKPGVVRSEPFPDFAIMRPPKRRLQTRIAGVTIPLFSLRGARSWGIGEISDLPSFAAWMKEIGIALVQILPLGEISGLDSSPYSALSAFGFDPIYIAIDALSDLPDPESAIGRDGADALARARSSPRVEYGIVRALKQRALGAAFHRFCERDARDESERARAFRDFCEAQRPWIDDYALYRAVKDAHAGTAWFDWPEPLRNREPRALE